MNLRCFEYVTEIVRCGSINKAAQNLHLSQPNLSASLKNLEAELGFQIFTRKSSGAELTPEGKLLLTSAEVILWEMEKIRKIPDAFSEKRNLSIVSTSSGLLMKSFIDFKMANPQDILQDTFKETGIIRAMMDVAENAYRMAIVYCFASTTPKQLNRAANYNLKMRRVGVNIPVRCMVGKNNPLARKKSIKLETLNDYPFATYENFDYDDWMGPLGISNTGNVLYVFDRGGLIDLIKVSSYLAVVMAGAPAPEVREIPIEDFEETLEVYVVTRKGYQLNPREKQLVRYLNKILKEYKF